MNSNEPDRDWTGRIAGQVVVVTGGGGIIGRAICRSFAEHGASVAVVDLNQDLLSETVALIEAKEGRVVGIQTDVSDPAAVERMAEAVQRELGPADLLINNAGLLSAVGPLWEVGVEAWWKVWEVNVRGLMLCAHAFLPAMVARGTGRIINMSSGSVLGPAYAFSAYPASKTAITRLTEHMALDCAPHGIGVFAITPGLVYTPLSNEIIESDQAKKWTSQYAGVYAEKHVPPELGAERCLEIAAGRADRLSGCYIQLADDLDDLTQRADDIAAQSLYRLRIQGETAGPTTPRVAGR